MMCLFSIDYVQSSVLRRFRVCTQHGIKKAIDLFSLEFLFATFARLVALACSAACFTASFPCPLA